MKLRQVQLRKDVHNDNLRPHLTKSIITSLSTRIIQQVQRVSHFFKYT